MGSLNSDKIERAQAKSEPTENDVQVNRLKQGALPRHGRGDPQRLIQGPTVPHLLRVGVGVGRDRVATAPDVGPEQEAGDHDHWEHEDLRLDQARQPGACELYLAELLRRAAVVAHGERRKPDRRTLVAPKYGSACMQGMARLVSRPFPGFHDRAM